MTETTRPLRIFLCHSSNDKPVVRELYQRLQAEGWIDAWLDTEKLYPGQDWNFEIEKAVEEADVILVCITNNSVTKEGYIQRELRMVLDFADYKPEGTLFVIPVRLEECDTPRRLRKWQYADYFPESDRDRAYQRLLVSLRMRAKRLELSTEFVLKEMEEKKRLNDIQQELEGVKHRLERKEIEINAVLEQANEKIEYERNKNIKMEEERLQRLAKENTLRAQEEKDGKEKEELEDRNVSDHAKLDAVDNIFSTKRPSSTNTSSRLLQYIIWLVIISLIVGFAGKALVDMMSNTPPISPVSTSTSSPTIIVPTNIIYTRLPLPSGPLEIGSTMISLKDRMSLMYVPAGEFIMGSDTGISEEAPLHTVSLNAYWIDQTEVTNAMYAKCVKDGKCEEPTNASSYTHPSYYDNSEFANYPVIYVDWNMAKNYCKWADRRLPTEAEWEKAARGENANIYPWGDESPNKDLLNYNSNVGDTTEVGKYPNGKSVYGTLDMAGNVWEWVSSLSKSYPYDAMDGREDMTSSDMRVLRGGTWNTDDYFLRFGSRNWNDPELANSYIGFRCARDTSP